MVVSLLSVGAFLVTPEDCVHPISESIQCEDCLKWEIFVPTHLAPTTINVQGKVPLHNHQSRQDPIGSPKVPLQGLRLKLFSVGRPEVIEQKAEGAFVKDQIGEFNEGHSWIIPKALLPELPPELRIYVGCATQLYGDLEPIHLIKIHFTSGKVSLLRYDDFSKETPLLVQRIKIKLRELEVDFFEYGGEYEPLPLSQKQHYCNSF